VTPTRPIALWAAAVACAAGLARAQDAVRVLSPDADTISVTVYRDGLALVTEKRTVDLPAAPVTLVIQNVVETLLPPSAVIGELGRPLAESNFDFDRLTPATLLARSLGTAVTITRTHPATGRVTRTPATLVAAGEGVILQSADGHEALYCSGLPERLELEALPAGLVAEPQLSVRLAAGPPGPRTVEVSYLAHGFGWSSDYVAHLNERSDRLRLSGWATLTNETGTVFTQAEVQLVAGVLNVLPAEEGGSAGAAEYPQEGETAVEARARRIDGEAATATALLRECFATELPERFFKEPLEAFDRAMPMTMRAAELDQIVVTAARIEREELGDYQLYRLPWRTDLGARQTKQVLFLERPNVEVERFYALRLDTFRGEAAEDVSIPELTLRFENLEAQGLGEPLPRGTVRVFEPYAGRVVFAGEAEIGDRPVGLPVELVIGRAQNVLLEIASDWRQERGARWSVATEHRIVNRKAVAIDVEIRHAVDGFLTDARVDRTSKPMRRKYGDFAWRFAVPPGEETLRYELSAREPR
jgi:hypothetical protein